jgi:hypothetical protein
MKHFPTFSILLVCHKVVSHKTLNLKLEVIQKLRKYSFLKDLLDYLFGPTCLFKDTNYNVFKTFPFHHHLLQDG